MNKQQKEILQAQIDNEKAVLKKLEANYKDAIGEINSKIELLMARQDADMQHVIYQVQYQQALKTQVQSILETLQTNEFETLSEYLTHAYEDSFIGTMYDLQGQGIPLIFPLDQAQILDAIQHETKLSSSLYTALGHDIKDLQKKIAGEISRGIASGQMYTEIARNVSSWARIPKNNAMRIARTEAHRIQCKAAMDAQHKAKEKGADVVKQWDATLDKRTRDSHRKVDGEIRELDETFSNGLKYPGDPSGRAEEVINCRCALLQRARWALGNDYTKWSEDAEVVIDDDGTTQFAIIEAKNYEDFQKKYKQASERVREDVQKMKSDDVLENNTEIGKIKVEDYIAFNEESNESEKLYEFISKLDGNEQKRWVKAFSDTEYEMFEGDSVSYYDGKKVYFNTKDTAEGAFHETAHAIDNGCIKIDVNWGTEDSPYMETFTSASQYLEMRMDYEKCASDLKNFANIIGVNADDNFFTDPPDVIFGAFNTWAKGLQHEVGVEGFGAVSDILSGISDDYTGGSLFYGGHTVSYWQKAVRGEALMVNQESWADFCSIKATKNEKALDLLKEVLPERYKMLEEVYERAFNT